MSEVASEPSVPLVEPHPGPIRALAVTRVEGRTIVVSGGEDSALRIWDLDSEQPVGQIVGPSQTTPSAVAIADLDGQPLVVSGWGDGIVRVNDLGTGAPVGGSLAQHRSGSFVTAIAVAPLYGRPFAASADSAGAILLSDVGLNKPEGELKGVHTEGLPVLDLVAATVDERALLASVSRDGSVAVWDLPARKTVWSHNRGAWGARDVPPLTAVAIWEVAGEAVLVFGSSEGMLYVDDLLGARSLAPIEGLAGITALDAATIGGARVLVSGHDDGTLHFWESYEAPPRMFVTSQSRVDALALTDSEDGRVPVVVIGGEDGRIRRWEPLSVETVGAAPAAAGRPDKVDWLTDAPADEDLLQRRPFARALGRRLVRIHEQDPDNAFLMHLDGAWGTGKSTILRFLRGSLEPDWLVVEFDAWRQSRVGPPWWALLVALRERLAAEATLVARARLRTAECWARIRRTGAPYVFAIIVLLLAAVGLALLLGAPSLTWTGLGETAKSASAILAALATLWAGGLLAARFLLWDSAKGAVVYEQTKANPMEALTDHFGWLLSRAGKPVAFFVDDLDRCSSDYVVDLLEALQTLIRGAPRRIEGADNPGGPYFVIAADGSWLRRSYEVRYDQFRDCVVEPGRPLGYLFLDKLFQLSVTVPTVTSQEKDHYLAGLLHVRGHDPVAAGEIDTVREEVRRSTTDDEVIGALQKASPAARRALAPDAVERLSDPAIEGATEHSLQGFGPLLEPNPRAMKRFVNAYGIARVVLTLENALVPSDALALWTIVRSRWPVLAEQLAKDPELVTYITGTASPPPDLPDQTRQLMSAPAVHQVITFPRGGPLTPATIRACAAGVLTPTETTAADP